MTVERLGEVLARAGLDLGPRELAETLWLAAHLGEAPSPAPPAEPPSPRQVRGPAVPTRPVPAAEPPPPPSDVERALHVPAAPRDEEPRVPLDDRPLRVPTAPMLGDVPGLQRALRPLKRRVPSRSAGVVNEEATAEYIADQPPPPRHWVPIMEPVAERWLRLALVADTGPSMELWRPLVRELRTALTQLGAFRDVRVWWLAADGPRAGVRPARGEGPVRDPSALVDPSGRLVVLVLSDCSGPHWWDGAAGRAVHLWARHGPTAILQPLPEKFWSRTAAPADPGTARLPRPAAPNTLLRFEPYEGDPEAAPGEVPVPVLELSAPWFADWARLVSGTAGQGVPCEVTHVGDRPHAPAVPVRAERGLNGRDRVRRFRAAASPEAVQLAAHLAVSVPSLPVMRLVQAATATTPRPSHLAEVMLSGLLRPAASGEGLYEFIDGARQALLEALPRSRALHTRRLLERVSARIESLAGSAADTFRAYLPSGDGTSGAASGAPIALVSEEASRILDRRVHIPPRISFPVSPAQDVPQLPYAARIAQQPPTAPLAAASGGPEAGGHLERATLTALVDDDLDMAAGIQALEHIASCAQCREEMEALQRLKQRLADARTDHLSDFPDPGRSRALVVAFDRYDNLPEQPLPMEGVTRFADVLTDPELVGLDEASCRVVRSPTAVELRDAVWTAARGASDTLIVSFTGYMLNLPGTQEGRLAARDATPDTTAGVLDVSEIWNIMRLSRARRRLLLVDGRLPQGRSAPARFVPPRLAMDRTEDEHVAIGVASVRAPSVMGAFADVLRAGVPGGGPRLGVQDVLVALAVRQRELDVVSGGTTRGAVRLAPNAAHTAGEDQASGPRALDQMARRYRDRAATWLEEQLTASLPAPGGSRPPHEEVLLDRGLDTPENPWAVTTYLSQHVGRLRANTVVLVGQPGLGKSTLLMRTALRICRQPQGSTRPIPLFWSVRTLAAFVTRNPRVTLAEALAESASPRLGRLPADWLGEALQAGQCVVLLDGFDELPDGTDSRMAEWLSRQIAAFPANDFVISTWPDRPALGALDANVFHLPPLTTVETSALVQSWYRFLADDQERAAERAGDLLAQLSQVPALTEVADAPALVPLLVIAHRVYGALPGRRVNLFTTLCRAALGARIVTNGSQGEEFTAERGEQVLGTLALGMLRRRREALTPEEAETLVIEPVERTGGSRRTARAFLDSLAETAELLRTDEHGLLSFTHPSLRDYLASTRLVADAEAEPPEARVGDRAWHETLRFYAAHTDATALAEACLAHGGAAASALAAFLVHEAHSIEPDTLARLQALTARPADEAAEAEPRPDDEELMRRHQAGDESAFGQLIARHAPRLYRSALGMLGDEQEAADAVQDATLEAFRVAARFDGTTPVDMWLTGFVVRACRQRIDRRSRTASVTVMPPDSLLARMDTAGNTVSDTDDTTMDVQAALASLPYEERAPIILADMMDYSAKDTALILGESEAIVRERLRNARTKLAPILQHLRDSVTKGPLKET
ncbi:MAG TPA: sigma-70 family RNA polymerase sigma factor [Thermomonospora sp.]|nr:sigma-70 family RNA polymerase sigma factor [Thermomonospora sp.]